MKTATESKTLTLSELPSEIDGRMIDADTDIHPAAGEIDANIQAHEFCDNAMQSAKAAYLAGAMAQMI